MLQMFTAYLILSASIIQLSQAIIGYDCGQKYANFSSFSLIDVEECNIPDPIINTTKEHIMLVQINEFITARVFYCRVEIKRTVQHCGMSSHVSTILGGEIVYLKDVSREECIQMHIHGTAKIGDNVIRDLKVNSTVTKSQVFAGSVDSTGACEYAGYYNDPYGEFYKVLVTGYVSFKLEERYESVDINANKIKLQSGTTCQFSETRCDDSYFGHAFWNAIPLGNCQEHSYTQLYKGHATVIRERGGENRPLYVVDSHDITFAFKDRGSLNNCNYRLIRTEHPRIFIVREEDKDDFPAVVEKDVNNFDMFAYVNSKFVFTERHIRGQMNRLYHDILLKQCQLERKILANALNIAVIAPDLFAYQLMKGPGYMSLLAGEVVHILKCVPVEVRVRETDDCYLELPVSRGNQSLFLTPKTHIIKEFGTKAICDNIIPVTYMLGGRWYKFLPKITSQDAPTILKPDTKQTWQYISPLDLANSGIYSADDINRLKTFIMFPNERAAVLNQLALTYAGKEKPSNQFSITTMFSEEAVTQLAESTWNKIYAKFITFGSASAAVITMIMIFRLIKFVIDTIIHGYTLHSIYGWSVYILASFWNTITHLLVHLAHRPGRQQEIQEAERESEQNHAHQASAPPQQPINPPQQTTVRVDVHRPESTNTSNTTHVIENRIYPPINIPEITSLNHHSHYNTSQV